MENNFGKVLAAFVGGVVVGGVAALLMAPKSGAELRADIDRMARETYADVERVAREKCAHLNREEMNALVARVRAKLADTFTRAEVEEAVEEALAEA